METAAGLIYWHVSDKGELLQAANGGLISGVWAQAVRTGASPQDGVFDGALSVFQALSERPGRAALDPRALAAGPEPAAPTRLSVRHRTQKLAGRVSGRLPPEETRTILTSERTEANHVQLGSVCVAWATWP